MDQLKCVRGRERMELATAAGGLLDVLAFFDVDAGFLICARGDCGCSHSFLEKLERNGEVHGKGKGIIDV